MLRNGVHISAITWLSKRNVWWDLFVLNSEESILNLNAEVAVRDDTVMGLRHGSFCCSQFLRGQSFETWKKWLFMTHLAIFPIYEMSQNSFGPVTAHIRFMIKLSDEYWNCGCLMLWVKKKKKKGTRGLKFRQACRCGSSETWLAFSSRHVVNY